MKKYQIDKKMDKFITRVAALRVEEASSKKEFDKKWEELNKDLKDLINLMEKGNK
jgi:hypothetical protein